MPLLAISLLILLAIVTACGGQSSSVVVPHSVPFHQSLEVATPAPNPSVKMILVRTGKRGQFRFSYYTGYLRNTVSRERSKKDRPGAVVSSANGAVPNVAPTLNADFILLNRYQQTEIWSFQSADSSCGNLQWNFTSNIPNVQVLFEPAVSTP